MALITDLTIPQLIHFVRFTGQTTGSVGTSETPNVFSSLADPSVVSTVDVDTTENLTTGFNIYYKLHGFNPITQDYEVWHCMGEPLLDPPSGNALQNITILFSWIDR